ncbi:Versicolorin B desaturase [Cyphellophora attinorum]|uniref:Versicolorin B desaturase n=1 Tax=Cyphellophora attinorum TaxID=1664694 RepID=A0A0N0NMQ1_9EURO|nr:Versicolorin B desaturase [Phialophora attinorum]KPI40469.1 Versicolorin B desaturase [Phialophora attinorum]
MAFSPGKLQLQLQDVRLYWAAPALVLLYLISLIIYRIFFHPLAKFPGPFLGKFTDIIPTIAMFKMERMYNQADLLERYGSPVRASTNQLYFSDLKSFTDIYGQSSNPCMKYMPFYSTVNATGSSSVLTEGHRNTHARIRRLISHAFSMKALLDNEALWHEKVEQLVQYVFAPAANQKQSVDIFHKMNCHYLDIVSYLSFGESFNSLQGKGDVTEHNMESFAVIVFAQAYIPFIRYIPSAKIQDYCRGLDELIHFAERSVKRIQDGVEKDGDSFAKGTFLRNLVDARDEETGGSRLTSTELVENTLTFLVAGSDTTSFTTMYLIWECGKNPKVREKLVHEIRTAFPDPDHAPTYNETADLPYLNACIDETLRLWGPLNPGFPRVSPGKVIGEHYVPAGAVVNTIPYAAHRDPKIFPNPLKFTPERWLDASADMRAMLRPFSLGPRNCIGKHLADINLHLTLTRLYQLFDIENDPSMTDAMMRQKDRGTCGPCDGMFLIRPRAAKY